MLRIIILILLWFSCGCGGRVTGDDTRETSASPSLAPIGCGAPSFEPGECATDILNDGGGSDDHRLICKLAGETWILYPSGEQWQTRESDGGTVVVLCHSGPDGGILW